MLEIVIKILQIIVALGLFNVWLVRSTLQTSYRGGDAKTLKEEFAVYGLPGWFCTVVGFLKVASAAMLLLGLWVPFLVLPASFLVAFLMLGAVAMHFKVRDPIKKAVPAALMLGMNIFICICLLIFHPR